MVGPDDRGACAVLAPPARQAERPEVGDAGGWGSCGERLHLDFPPSAHAVTRSTCKVCVSKTKPMRGISVLCSAIQYPTDYLTLMRTVARTLTAAAQRCRHIPASRCSRSDKRWLRTFYGDVPVQLFKSKDGKRAFSEGRNLRKGVPLSPFCGLYCANAAIISRWTYSRK